jgi:hypothetical protein
MTQNVRRQISSKGGVLRKKKEKKSIKKENCSHRTVSIGHPNYRKKADK